MRGFVINSRKFLSFADANPPLPFAVIRARVLGFRRKKPLRWRPNDEYEKFDEFLPLPFPPLTLFTNFVRIANPRIHSAPVEL